MPSPTHALLLAAGLGTRLRPLTLVRAKPAVPVAGVPIARRIISWLRGAGVTDVVLNLHYLPETIAAVIGDGSDLGVRARYSWEQPVVLGSAGGPRQALDIIGQETFLLVNGDTLTNADLTALADDHASNGGLVTLAVIPNRRPHQYSGLRVAADGTVLGVEPRGSARASFHFVGAQIAHRSVFAHVPSGHVAASIGGVYDEWMASKPGSIRAHVCEADFSDIGTVSDYWVTSQRLTPGTMGSAGRAVAIGAGSSVTDSVVWDNVDIGERCHLSHCIITDNVRVPNGETCSNMVLLRGPEGDLVRVPLTLENG